MSTPSQPSLNQAYETPGNPVSKEPAEQTRSAQNAQAESLPSTTRGPNDTNPDPTPTSLGRGIHGGAPVNSDPSAGGPSTTTASATEDAEQMGAPGEGKVASAVERKPGASGSEPGLETDLDRKKAEQAPERAAVQAEERREIDVGAVLGQRGGPAESSG